MQNPHGIHASFGDLILVPLHGTAGRVQQLLNSQTPLLDAQGKYKELGKLITLGMYTFMCCYAEVSVE